MNKKEIYVCIDNIVALTQFNTKWKIISSHLLSGNWKRVLVDTVGAGITSFIHTAFVPI